MQEKFVVGYFEAQELLMFASSLIFCSFMEPKAIDKFFFTREE